MSGLQLALWALLSPISVAWNVATCSRFVMLAGFCSVLSRGPHHHPSFQMLCAHVSVHSCTLSARQQMHTYMMSALVLCASMRATTSVQSTHDPTMPPTHGSLFIVRKHSAWARLYHMGGSRFSFCAGTTSSSNQMQSQVLGLSDSLECINQALSNSAPYDGCLAFSQGCALATVLVAIQELKQQETEHTQRYKRNIEKVVAACQWNFSFVMLCSGHLGCCSDAHDIVSAARPLQTPSLHIFGAPGHDKQVEHAASLALFHTYAGGQAIVHDKGHIVPSARSDVNVYTDFFVKAMRR